MIKKRTRNNIFFRRIIIENWKNKKFPLSPISKVFDKYFIFEFELDNRAHATTKQYKLSFHLNFHYFISFFAHRMVTLKHICTKCHKNKQSCLNNFEWCWFTLVDYIQFSFQLLKKFVKKFRTLNISFYIHWLPRNYSFIDSTNGNLNENMFAIESNALFKLLLN